MRKPTDNIADRFYCRNARCSKKLTKSIADPRHAFCDSTCYAAHYRLHCVVCERPLRTRTHPGQFCSERCRSRYRRDAARYKARWAPEMSPATPVADATGIPPKTPTKSKSFLHENGDRPLRLIGPRDWPIDLLGGNRNRPRGPHPDASLRRRIQHLEIGGER